MKATIIYDDASFKRRAIAALTGAARYVGLDTDWNIVPWQADLLTDASNASEAFAESTDAPLVTIAGLYAQRPPVWLMVWLENWAINRQIIDSALAVMGEQTHTKQSASNFIQLFNFARRHGLKFIVHDDAKDQTAFDFLARHATAVVSAFSPTPSFSRDTALHFTSRGWGINE